MQKDNYFSQPLKKQFSFDKTVAPVFDDMLFRSIPFYEESLELTADLIARYVEKGTAIDLGCSTGSLLIKLAKKTSGALTLIGIDNAPAMIEMAQNKAEAFGAKVQFLCKDVDDLEFSDLGAVSANYFLQFIRPPKRFELLCKIHNWLAADGVFVFSEKLTTSDKKLDKIMIDKYLDYKREKGYSDYEISQKREALENVLIPYTEDENKELIKKAGFRHIETVLRWNNFASFIAIK